MCPAMRLAVVMMLLVAITRAATWTSFSDANCFNNNGAINIDTANSASPPRENVTLQASNDTIMPPSLP